MKNLWGAKSQGPETNKPAPLAAIAIIMEGLSFSHKEVTLLLALKRRSARKRNIFIPPRIRNPGHSQFYFCAAELVVAISIHLKSKTAVAKLGFMSKAVLMTKIWLT